MINFNTLLDDIIAAYQTVPEVLQALKGEEAAIYKWIPARPDNPNYEDQLSKMAWPSILVSHVSTELGFRGTMPQWKHTFRLDVKIMGDTIDYPTLIQALVDGIPGGAGGLSVIQCSFNDAVDSLESPLFSREIDDNGKYYYRFEFSLQEKGGMGI